MAGAGSGDGSIRARFSDTSTTPRPFSSR
jgi:hypothetical protein